VRACGRPLTAWFQKTALAWEIGVDIPAVTDMEQRGPQIAFRYRGGEAASPPVPDGAQVLETDEWLVVATCRDGRPMPFGASAR